MSASPYFLRLIAPLFFGAALLGVTGCYHYDETRSIYSSGGAYGSLPADRPATALVIVIQGECTEAQYLAWRGQVVSYLIERGYIASESELISDPAQAQRVIRAIVGAGGFTLSVFNATADASPPPDLEFTDIYYPADPYFIFGFLYFGEIGPRHLPPRPPDYRPHPRAPGAPPPRYPRYDHDRHWPHAPRTGDREHHPRPPGAPSDHGRWNPPPAQPPTDQAPVPPANRPHHRPPTATPPKSTPPAQPPAHQPRTSPAGPREHPREHKPEPGHHRPEPSTRVSPSAPSSPSPPPPKAEKKEREDEDKRPHRPEPER
ncbi:MAG: hypothetical protein HYV95_07160 [Opitutae bacterium]|nr:hypothetical protein [Opitutae bacterium]